VLAETAPNIARSPWGDNYVRHTSARPGYRATLHGEFALGALEGRFSFLSLSRQVRVHRRMHPYPGRPPKCWGGARRAQWLTSTVSVAALPPPQNPTCRDRPVGARAEGPTRPVWVGRLSGWVVSNLYETPRMAISLFLDPAPSLLLQDLAPAGGAASSRPRKTPRPAAMSWSVGGSAAPPLAMR
jgi:hypothetical protein